MPKQLVQFIFTLLFFFTGANALAQNNWQVLPERLRKAPTIRVSIRQSP